MRDGNKKANGEDINSALLKKALGFDAKEIVEEYASDGDGEIRLSKKKITIKSVPPDVAALKMLLELKTPLSEYTDDELEEEKQRLLEVICQNEKKKKEKTNCRKKKEP
ncbi:MAG: hypothetical protein IJQ87_05230 [Clostridia bacterium]|nr:hypothetical protein [Clostridia bacterium]